MESKNGRAVTLPVPFVGRAARYSVIFVALPGLGLAAGVAGQMVYMFVGAKL